MSMYKIQMTRLKGFTTVVKEKMSVTKNSIQGGYFKPLVKKKKVVISVSQRSTKAILVLKKPI